MMTFQDAGWATQQTRPPIPLPFRQTPVWDEGQQQVGIIIGNSSICNQSSFDSPYTQIQPRHNLAAQLRRLQQDYTIIDNDRDVIGLLAEHARLFTLLTQAVQHLRSAFGENRLFHVRVQHSDEDSLLKVAVQLPVDFPEPETALHVFDTTWWINNCQRSSGALVFDYEIQDAV
jgi:hypothetical protein